MTYLVLRFHITHTAIAEWVNDKDDDEGNEDHQVDVSNGQRGHQRDIKPLLRVDLGLRQLAHLGDITSRNIVIIDSWHIQGQIEVNIITIHEPCNLGDVQEEWDEWIANIKSPHSVPPVRYRLKLVI